MFETYRSRLDTFQNYCNTQNIKLKRMELADAGFFYCGDGLSDETKCYSCGGGLNNWLPADDPWEQHVMWFPKCYHVYVSRTSDCLKKRNKHRSVTFNKNVVYHLVPGKEEDRFGTWHVDALHFKMRISRFESIFMKTMNEKNLNNII